MAERRDIASKPRDEIADFMSDTLERFIYPVIKSKLLFMLPASPLSLIKRFICSYGAITGWSLEDKPPVAPSLTTVFSSIHSCIPHVPKAGQWKYSPTGLPFTILLA